MALTRSREKFIELAEKRVVKTIKDLRLIGNLANRNNYEYSKADADKILSALEKELKAVKSKFANGGDDGSIEFNL